MGAAIAAVLLAAVVVAIVQPGDLGDEDQVAGPGTTTTAPTGTTGTTAPPTDTTAPTGTTAPPTDTTAPTGTTAPGGVTTTTEPDSGLGGEGAGQVGGGLADSGGPLLAPLGIGLLAGSAVVHAAARGRRRSG